MVSSCDLFLTSQKAFSGVSGCFVSFVTILTHGASQEARLVWCVQQTRSCFCSVLLGEADTLHHSDSCKSGVSAKVKIDTGSKVNLYKKKRVYSFPVSTTLPWPPSRIRSSPKTMVVGHTKNVMSCARNNCVCVCVLIYTSRSVHWGKYNHPALYTKRYKTT